MGVRSRFFRLSAFVAAVAAALVCGGCNTVDDNRIPSVNVNLNLASVSLWDTYGVSAYGDSRIFIRQLGEPRDFPYTDRTATGYGGLLIVCGLNPFTLEAGVPMAYDLSCPVECKPDVRVRMEDVGVLPEAVCPVCGSHYDVVERGGAPVSGPALSHKYGLRRYEVRDGTYGGYFFTNI